MAHLAAVTAGPDERSPVDEQAAADTDVAAEVDHIVGVGGSTTHLLGEYAEVRVVTHRDGPGSPEARAE